MTTISVQSQIFVREYTVENPELPQCNRFAVVTTRQRSCDSPGLTAYAFNETVSHHYDDTVRFVSRL